MLMVMIKQTNVKQTIIVTNRCHALKLKFVDSDQSIFKRR